MFVLILLTPGRPAYSSSRVPNHTSKHSAIQPVERKKSAMFDLVQEVIVLHVFSSRGKTITPSINDVGCGQCCVT
eukprot:4644332-Prymnesium_polylepis.1